MKKRILVFCFCAAAALLSAEEININGNFKGSRLNAAAPKGWRSGAHEKKAAVITTPAGKLAWSVQTGKERTWLRTESFIPFNPGDKMEVRLKAGGKGAIRVEYWGFSAERKNFVIGTLPGIRLTPEEKEYQGVLVGRNVKNKDYNLVSAWVVVTVSPDTEAVISDIKANLIPVKPAEKSVKK